MAPKLTYRDGRIHGFELKFRSLDDDTERYLFALVDLLDAGEIEKVPGQALINSHYDGGRDWIIDRYFEEGRLDQIEAYFTPQGEVMFGPIYEGERVVLDRFEAMGEGGRVRRIWRAHVGLLKSTFWFYVNERKRGFRYEPGILNASQAAQRKSHDEFVGRIPTMKTQLLEIMAEFRAVSVRTGAKGPELARIDADIASVTAEEKPRYAGPTDRRAMDEDVFWELIRDTAQPLGERLDALPDRLAAFKPTAIRKFDQILRETHARAYRNDIWALAYLLQGGCSDDAFDAFRGWLILQGRAVFDAALADPDAFDASLHSGQAGGMDALRDAAPLAYDMRQGKAMKPVKVKPAALTGPDWDEDAFHLHLPRIATAVGWND